MIKFAILSLTLISYLGTVVTAQESKSITDAETVISIYTNDWGLGSSDGPRLIMSVWGDGSIVWSNDRIKGGSPYFKSKVDPKDVSATLKRLVSIGAFDVPRLGQANFGPDSQFTTILVQTDGKELKMDSWHELYESNGKVIAADHGLTGLGGKKLLQTLAEQPADYLHYRMSWLELKLAATNLIPSSGDKTVGVPKMLHGKLTWQPNGTEPSDEPKSR
jgi:hypothetical protein